MVHTVVAEKKVEQVLKDLRTSNRIQVGLLIGQVGMITLDQNMLPRCLFSVPNPTSLCAVAGMCAYYVFDCYWVRPCTRTFLRRSPSSRTMCYKWHAHLLLKSWETMKVCVCECSFLNITLLPLHCYSLVFMCVHNVQQAQ